MKNLLKNNGLSIVNAPKERFEKATIVVLGLGRSGTSLVSQILINSGIFMGEGTSATGEDIEIANFLDNNQFKELGLLIASRTEKYDYWGWKRPNTINFLDDIDPLIENPIYVCLFRDLLAISKRNEVSMGRDVLEGLGHAIRSYTRLVNFISKTDKTCILTSFEKLKNDHEALITGLNEVLDKEFKYTSSMKENVVNAKSQYMVDSYGLKK